MKTIFALLILLGLGGLAHGQVNAYAKVTGIIGPLLTVSNVDETYGSFTNGSKVIVMQMQDDVIGSNTSNNSSFGSLSSIASAGRYEVATILLRVDIAGVLSTITLSNGLSTSFNTGSNSSVQIISYPTLGSPNFTTTSDITAVPWNGNTGGVVAFTVNGVLTLNHNILAEGAGFRGGATDATSNAGSCDNSNYFSAAHDYFGYKGEGIYKVTNTNFTSGMGRMINGGGGGNSHNAGGGGGGNYTAGGTGSMGYGCSISNGGQPGISLAPYVIYNRAFLGGGAGGGEANNGYNTKGGNGGGIILIKANQIQTTGTGSAVRISSNGASAASVGNDGAGGGGAGGTQMLDVPSYNIASTKPLIISSNGGNGGSVGDGSRHGGGAGGGQGLLMFGYSVPTSNVTVNTMTGSGGRDWTGGTFAENGAGTNNSGIMPSVMTVLSVKLVSFTAVKNGEAVKLNWNTQNEKDINRYDVQRSTNGSDFVTIGRVASNATAQTNSYAYADGQSLKSTVFYRLAIVDQEGKVSYSKVVVITNTSVNSVNVLPNPSRGNATVQVISTVSGTASIRILNIAGGVVAKQQSALNAGTNSIALESVSALANGVYNVEVVINGLGTITRLVVAK